MRVLLAVLLAAAIVPAAWGADGPRVRLMSASPATVAGTGFTAGERVVVSVSTDATHLSKAIVVTEHGAFVAHFEKTVAASGCGRVAIVAVGSAGDRASWKSAPRSCGAPMQPITQ